MDEKTKAIVIDKSPICDIYEHIQGVTGQKSSSASPSDTWFLTFQEGSVVREFEDKTLPLENAFLKLSVTSQSWTKIVTAIRISTESKYFKGMLTSLKALEYERDVYLKLIKPMLSNNICPHFVRCYNGGDCTYENLQMLAKMGGISPINLARNIDYIFFGISLRPAIDGPDIINDKSTAEKKRVEKYQKLLPVVTKHMKFSYIVSEQIKGETFADNMRSYDGDPFEEADFIALLFQICYACYCMYRSDLVHNDLHTKNIWIVDSPSIDVEYTVDGKVYSFGDIIKLAKVYDFDRSYAKSLGTNDILDGFDAYSQVNKVVNLRDFVKVMCYVYSATKSEKVFDILNINSDEGIEYWTNAFKVGGCFLQEKEGKEIPDSKYEELKTSYPYILDTLHYLYREVAGDPAREDHDILKYHCNKDDFNNKSDEKKED